MGHFGAWTPTTATDFEGMGKKLYVGNLNFRTTDDSLAAAFVAKGFAVASVKVITDRETGRSRGFAFVEMETDEGAAKALGAMHDHDVEGRPIKVTEARAKTDGPGGGGFRSENRGGFGGAPSSGGGYAGGPPRSGGYAGGGDARGRDDRAPRSDAPRFGRDGDRGGQAPRFGDSRGAPRGGGFGGMPGGMPPGANGPFPPTEEAPARRGRGERRDLRKQFERRDDDHDDDDF